MTHYKNIVKVLDHVSQWPDTKPHHYKVEVLGSDNKRHDVIIHETEYEIWKYFLEHPERVSVERMQELIEAYGQYQYELGMENAAETESL